MDKSLLFQGRGRMSCSAKYFPTFGWHMEMSSWLWPIRIPISLTKNTDGNYSLVRIKDPDFCWRLGEWWRWARKEMLGGELWWKIIWERECIYIICMTGSLCLIADIGVNLVNQIHFNLKRWGEKWQGKSIGYEVAEGLWFYSLWLSEAVLWSLPWKVSGGWKEANILGRMIEAKCLKVKK